jgi:competence ComEA-like helix-hairpin-helix protein
MGCNLRKIIFCCSAVFLLTDVGAAFAAVSQTQNQNTNTMLPASNGSPKQLASVSINTTDVTSLQKVKGMSKKKAQAIVEYRDKNGPFKSLEDLLKINCRGIHKKWLDKISKFLTL